MEHDFIKTAEVAGNVLRTAVNVGKFVAERLFTCGGWALDITDETYQGIMTHMDNIVKGEE